MWHNETSILSKTELTKHSFSHTKTACTKQDCEQKRILVLSVVDSDYIMDSTKNPNVSNLNGWAHCHTSIRIKPNGVG